MIPHKLMENRQKNHTNLIRVASVTFGLCIIFGLAGCVFGVYSLKNGETPELDPGYSLIFTAWMLVTQLLCICAGVVGSFAVLKTCGTYSCVAVALLIICNLSLIGVMVVSELYVDLSMTVIEGHFFQVMGDLEKLRITHSTLLEDLKATFERRQCCGAYSPADWGTFQIKEIPDWCCKSTYKSLCKSLLNRTEDLNISFSFLLQKEVIYEQGCLAPAVAAYRKVSTWILTCAGLNLAVLLVAVAIAAKYSRFLRLRRASNSPQ